MASDSNCLVELETPLGRRKIASLPTLAERLGVDLSTVPFSIRVLLESCLRRCGDGIVTDEDVAALARYDATAVGETEIPFMPARVILQDFTGVPALVDLAAMRDAIVAMTGDAASAAKVNPRVQCDLIIDHSVQVDVFNSPQALTINAEHEFTRNKERYEFLKWGQSAFDHFKVVPPETGIVHQVNLEYLATVVRDQDGFLIPDSLVGTDSHTTMIDGLGVVGWGVGGIEAEAVMLGQPIYMLIPEVVGFELTGTLTSGCTATDLVLHVTQMLREHGVVAKFVEFFGEGLHAMPVANRATIGNMAPEYGATMGYFPVDEQTLAYLHMTGRDEALIETVEQYFKAQGLWHDPAVARPTYSSTLTLDLSTVETSLAGPKRPQDRIALGDMQSQWKHDLSATLRSEGDPAASPVDVALDGEHFEIGDGSVVIAAITSCTNTSNPDVMIGAGLLARNATSRGLTRKPWVKTSLAPGSKVVTEYLQKAGLMTDLEQVGFSLVGYGCTTCIGNSGPLPEPIHDAIDANDLVATSVLSGNRNFEGRISPDVRANYLASPPLVVAYALAGTVDIDLSKDPLGQDQEGNDVMLSDIWPTAAEIATVVESSLGRDQFIEQYADVYSGPQAWQAIDTTTSDLFHWASDSTYIHCPPFFDEMTATPPGIHEINGARVLVKVGDSVTTDHISPAGSIATDSPAGKYLIEHDVPRSLFNSYGSRRGNDLVLTRGTFANIRIRNQIAPGTEGGLTTDFTDGEVKPIYDASCNYQKAGVPLIVLAGQDYGMGSSRDWAAKGPCLLGVKAVIARSFERIHRSNLVGMGILPLEFRDSEDAQSLGLDGTETFSIPIDESLTPRQQVDVSWTREDGSSGTVATTCRIDTPVEVEYYRNGGILHTVLRRMAAED